MDRLFLGRGGLIDALAGRGELGRAQLAAGRRRDRRVRRRLVTVPGVVRRRVVVDLGVRIVMPGRVRVVVRGMRATMGVVSRGGVRVVMGSAPRGSRRPWEIGK